MSSFSLAPMDLTMKASTGICLALPPLLGMAGLRSSGPESLILIGAAVFSMLLYGGVWLWLKPTRFELTREDLVVLFPRRTLTIPRASITGARLIERAEFRENYGPAVRVGAGGLWGGFGFLWTTKRGRVDMYISRLDRFTLIERRGAPDLLLSVEPAAEFAAALR